MPLLQTFVDAPPTAELEPITESYTQTDEVDMVSESPEKLNPLRGRSTRLFVTNSALKDML